MNYRFIILTGVFCALAAGGIFVSRKYSGISIITGKQASYLHPTPYFTTLLDDMKLYKLDKLDKQNDWIHGGDLFEHSVWVYNAMWQLMNTHSLYAKGLVLSDREKKIIAFAAFLHDVGKAGRSELFKPTDDRSYKITKNHAGEITKIMYKPDHREHATIGFEYFGGRFFSPQSKFQKRFYRLSNGSIYDFDRLCHEMGITQDEQKLIAILIGIHWDFGDVKRDRMTREAYINKLRLLTQAVNYNNNQLSQQLVQLAVLIQVADVKGLYPCDEHEKTFLFAHPMILPCTRQGCQSTPYILWEYDEAYYKHPEALDKMHQLLNYYESH